MPAAVAIETLKIYDETDIGAHVREVGAHLQAELRRRFADHPLVGEVRGVGLIARGRAGGRQGRHTEFRPGRENRRPLDQADAKQNGVIGRTVANDVLCFSPPLIITKPKSTKCSTAWNGRCGH